jgi:hypothetical protein
LSNERRGAKEGMEVEKERQKRLSVAFPFYPAATNSNILMYNVLTNPVCPITCSLLSNIMLWWNVLSVLVTQARKSESRGEENSQYQHWKPNIKQRRDVRH